MTNDSERRQTDNIIFIWTMDNILHIYITNINRLNLFFTKK